VWRPPREPPAWVRQAHSRLPVRPNNKGPTHGEAFTTDGQTVRLRPRGADKKGGSQLIPSGEDLSLTNNLNLTRRERLAESMLSHVEVHVAAAMRLGDLPKDTVLVINNWVCGGELSCKELLPSILMPGHRLTIYETGPDGGLRRKPVVMVGTGERIKP
jgi:hypothetical protein